MTVAPAPARTSKLRVAGPSRDLPAAETSWVQGSDLQVLCRTPDEDDAHALLELGLAEAAWHPELVRDPAGQPTAAEEDLLVLHLGAPLAADRSQRMVEAGGRRVPPRKSYWDEWGVTIAEPGGYRVVLSLRTWSNCQQPALS